MSLKKIHAKNMNVEKKAKFGETLCLSGVKIQQV